MEELWQLLQSLGFKLEDGGGFWVGTKADKGEQKTQTFLLSEYLEADRGP